MNPGVLLSLVDEGHLPLLARGFESAIAHSLSTDNPPMRHPTSAEVKRRFEICLRITKALRGDKKWGVARITDKLPSLLRMELDGQDWDKHTEVQRMWTPDAPAAIDPRFRGILRSQ
jgi:hypothetical protein